MPHDLCTVSALLTQFGILGLIVVLVIYVFAKPLVLDLYFERA